VEPEFGIGVSYDPEKAKKWLAEAGYPDGRGFPEITLQFNESETHWKIAKAVQTLLKHHLNIDLGLEALEWEAYLDARSKKLEAEMIRFNWCADYPDANNWLNELFHPDKSDNIIEWDNEEFGMLMDMAQRETDPEDRKVLYARAEQILCEVFCAVVPIYFETAHYLVNPRVKGWYGMAMGGQHIRNWRLED
jgi:oligopeptide transport system substrate-binding protein